MNCKAGKKTREPCFLRGSEHAGMLSPNLRTAWESSEDSLYFWKVGSHTHTPSCLWVHSPPHWSSPSLYTHTHTELQAHISASPVQKTQQRLLVGRGLLRTTRKKTSLNRLGLLPCAELPFFFPLSRGLSVSYRPLVSLICSAPPHPHLSWAPSRNSQV